MAETFNVVVEIPRGSKNKYEVDQASGRVFLDRTLFTAMGYPDDYGYIDGTLGEDGDPLDCLVMVSDSVFPGCIIKCRAVGLYHMVDEEGGDDKVLAVPDDVRYDNIQDISDVSEYHKAEIKHFFEQYKALEPGKEVMPGDYWADKATAEKEIKAARERLAASLKEEEKKDAVEQKAISEDLGL
ncbi:inorganic diphosphatase [Bifidobacterium choloepi]|uniref:Inorganic pyrophosphatase n=1 Tax=Bifidobacterium choloepi TaxID=2614131 RepID=A0A6I5NIV3_9BIFI|nr:inorganic diphosphatase [Bifidobacterium choloepi]NEG70313.1 inorganic diphosphatase [Bifidobacterium choloepi]